MYEQKYMWGFLSYMLLMNFLGIVVMREDKRRARKQMWRIPEKILWFVSLLGGSLGSWMGIYLYRHKTKHWNFVIGMPAIVLVHMFLIANYLMQYRL